MGRRIVVNQDVAVMAANAKSILFGDFSLYTIRDVMSAEVRRFDDSAFARERSGRLLRLAALRRQPAGHGWREVLRE